MSAAVAYFFGGEVQRRQRVEKYFTKFDEEKQTFSLTFFMYLILEITRRILLLGGGSKV